MLDQNKKYKIALIGDSLALGGAEKVMALLSIYFEKNGLEVHNCIFIDNVSYNFLGNLLNLGTIKSNKSSLVRKFYRFWAFQKFIKNNAFDCIIDFRMRPTFFLEFILSKFIYPKNVFYTVHSGFLDFYFPKSTFLSKLIYSNRKIVTVSKAIQNKIIENQFSKNVDSISNPIDFVGSIKLNSEAIIDENYIIAVGNMNNTIKQIDKLIISYSKSDLPNQSIKLIILGDGVLKSNYQELVKQLELEKFIHLKGTVQNPFPYYKNAKFLVLASKNEGFPNAIIESLSCETPVIAFDCFSGPNEIITNHHNGILVDNQDFDKFTQAMNLMITDQDLYKNCKKKALQSVQKFSLEHIGKQWLAKIIQ